MIKKSSIYLISLPWTANERSVFFFVFFTYSWWGGGRSDDISAKWNVNTALSRIWTQVANSISYNGSGYAQYTSGKI